MKKIAVLIYDLTIEYHITIIRGISDFFKDKTDVNLMIVPLKAAHAAGDDYGYQYWTCLQLMQSRKIDGFIIVTNSFAEYMTSNTLQEELEPLSKKPMVSIAVPLRFPDCRYTYISSEKPYKDIVGHLVNKHGKKRIAFFSAELSGSLEADERLQSYKTALEAYNLPYDEKLVYPGDFTPDSTYNYITKYIKSKEDLPFDALLCANDYMAGGAIQALRNAGIQVPEDVAVIGFDDSDISRNSVPTLTTINQNLIRSGYNAAEVIYKVLKKQDAPLKVPCNCTPVYRQSCGCIPLSNHTAAYIDADGVYHDTSIFQIDNLNLFGNALNDMRSINEMLNITEVIADVNEYYNTLIDNLKRQFIPFCAFCLYEEEYTLSPDDSFTIPDRARLQMFYDREKDLCHNFFSEGGILFNPRENLLPPVLGKQSAGTYCLTPIFIREKNYGYVIYSFPPALGIRYTVNEIYMKILTNAFVHAYEYTRNKNKNQKLEAMAEELSKESRTDELTQVFNRRGFMEYAQRMLDLSIATGSTGSVFFMDMDGLKKINDTWGHKTGDIAIQTLAEVLKEAFHKSDIIGRLSGDEFAVIAPGFDKSNSDLLRRRIESLCERISKEKNLPMIISTSFGIADYSADKSKLTQLLMQADKELYKEKEIKHSR